MIKVNLLPRGESSEPLPAGKGQRPFIKSPKTKIVLFAVIFFIAGLVTSVVFQDKISNVFTFLKSPPEREVPSQAINVVEEDKSEAGEAQPFPPSKEYTLDTSYPYTVHVASFPTEKEALENVHRLEDMGYKGYISKVEIAGKGVWYRLLVGKFKTKANARRMAKRLRQEEGISYAQVLSTSYALGKPH